MRMYDEKSKTWTIYEFSQAEFKSLLGIEDVREVLSVEVSYSSPVAIKVRMSNR